MPVRILAALFTLLPALYGQSANLQVWEKPVSPGLTYRMEVDSDTPLIVRALRFSPRTPGLRAIPELAGHTINEEGTVKGRLTPAQMASQASAIAAINGDFFSFSQGAPIGLMVRSGELLDTPFKARATFGWGPEEAAIAMCSTTVSMTPEDGKETKVDELNQPIGQNQIALYTSAEGTAQLAGSHVAVMLSVSNPTWSPSSSIQATVDSVLPDAPEIKVPDGKALVVGTGDKMAMMQSLRVGQKMIFQLQTQGFDWEKIENVIGGGPVLLRDSKVAIDAEAEGFPASFYAKRHPRTAIGRTSAGDIWLVAIDGRQEISAGATLDETAKVMLRLGCSDAMNLDGGGSTCLNLQGITVNRPSDGVERPVSNGILILGPKLTTYDGELKVVVPPKIALAGKTSVHLTFNGKLVPNADVIWGAQGGVWIDQGGALHPLELGKAKIKASAYGKVVSVDVTVVEKVTSVRRRRTKVQTSTRVPVR
jgi:exopolysaccharide biosynthesis protein